MGIVLAVAGLAVVLLVIFDFLLTTISLRREGPMARAVSAAVGSILKRLPMAVRRYGGPITLSAIAGAWILGLWFGWTLIFLAARDVLAGPEGNTAVGLWDAAAFAGSTLSSMGLGVVTPTEAWAHIVTVAAAVSGILVLTLSVTYVLNVSQVASRSRSVALHLRDLTHVLEAAPSHAQRVDILMGSAHTLQDMLHTIVDQRNSFPLAQLYEVEGSPRDIALRADTLRGVIDGARQAAQAHERTQMELLSNTLRQLTRNDDS